MKGNRKKDDKRADENLEILLGLGLMQAIGPVPLEDGSVEEAELNYVVPPLVKRYFRQVLERSPQDLEMREFGLHGLLSRGPFNSPGISGKAKLLFEHFVKYSFCEVKIIICGTDQVEGRAAFSIRAVLDILRSNFACNSVPLWGQFRDYIDMLSICIDLLRNYANAATDEIWEPGTRNTEEQQVRWTSDNGVASAEEMLYLYNELGLAYYHTGSVQDALRVWGLASDWRKAVSVVDPEQGEMYAATLNSHFGMAYMQLGRMQTATECFEKALAAAKKTDDPDLTLRMEGMLARVAHFCGSVHDARKSYKKVVTGLAKLGNRRAQSYFMRHLAALEARFGDIKEAEKMAQESMAIAASENAADLVAFASELKGRVYKAARADQNAIREYSIALVQAERLDISRLKIDIRLGMADIQLRLGDISAARASAIEALKHANENLLVLRQVKALVILGKAAKEIGEVNLARCILEHARRLAAESQFRLAEHDAEEELAALRAGGGEQADAVL